MNYGQLLKRAWQITWRYKVLWAFGIAAALFQGGFGGGGFQYRFGAQDMARWRQMAPMMPWWGRGFANIQAAWPILAAVIGVVLIMGLILAIVGIIVRYTSVGALIAMVDEVEEAQETTFKAGLARGWRRFLYLLAIDLLIGLGAFLVACAILLILGGIGLIFMAPGILLLAAGEARALGIAWMVIVGLFFFLIFILAMIALAATVTIVQAWAERACILRAQNVFGAIGRGFALLRARLKESLSVWVVMWLVGLALGIILLPIMAVVIGLGVGAGTAAYSIFRSAPWVAILAVPFLALIGLAGVFVAGVYQVFRSAVWTLAFRELAPEEGEKT